MKLCFLCTKRDKLESFGKDYLLCSRCCLIYANRDFTESELDIHYSEYYGETISKVGPATTKRYREIVKKLEPYRSAKNSVLEIGCGSGDLLEEFRRSGWNVLGSEISKSAIELMKTKNLSNMVLNFQKDQINDQFDVILLFETLEHVPLPIELLKFCKRALREGGIVFGTTPNSCSINSRLLGSSWSIYGLPEHLNIFSKKALVESNRKVKFAKIVVRTRGFNPYELKRYFPKSPKVSKEPETIGVGRVQAGASLNEMAYHSKTLGMVKSIVNFFLAYAHIGDSLEFRFIK